MLNREKKPPGMPGKRCKTQQRHDSSRLLISPSSIFIHSVPYAISSRGDDGSHKRGKGVQLLNTLREAKVNSHWFSQRHHKYPWPSREKVCDLANSCAIEDRHVHYACHDDDRLRRWLRWQEIGKIWVRLYHLSLDSVRRPTLSAWRFSTARGWLHNLFVNKIVAIRPHYQLMHGPEKKGRWG